jgi:hypothetical protein
MWEFDPQWISCGLEDPETKNLLAECDCQAIRDPEAFLGKTWVVTQVDPLREGSAFHDLVEESEKVLEHFEISHSREKLSDPVAAIESFCGDDEVGIASNPYYLAMKRVIYPILGMRVSEPDTSLNPRWGNYAEDLILLPIAYQNTYETTRLTGFFEDMAYLDLPKLRLNIFVSPARPDHSGTMDGKTSMTGKRVAWTPKRSVFRWFNELASVHQDLVLGLHRSKRPAYLPVELGGLGKTPAFSNPLNWRNYFLSWKGGERFEFTNQIMHHLDALFRKRIAGLYAPVPPVLANLSRFNCQFRDWLKSRSIYAPQFWLERPDWASEYIVDYFGKSGAIDSALSRGIKEGDFVSEETLLVHAEHAQQCEALLNTRSWTEYIASKEAIVQEWKRLSIYGQASLGMIQEIKPDFRNGNHQYNPAVVKRVFDYLSERGNDLKSLLRKSPAYRREVIDRLYDRSVMHVNMTLTPTEWAGTSTFLVDKDVLNTEHIKHWEVLKSWILSPEPRGDPPMDLIEDDHLIVRKCGRNPHSLHVIVTDDIKLCRRIDEEHGMPCIRVPTAWHNRWVNQDKWEVEDPDSDPPWVTRVREMFPDKTLNMIEDTGSIEAMPEKQYLEGIAYTEPVRFKIAYKCDTKGGKIPFYKAHLGEKLFLASIGAMYPQGYVFDRRNLLGLRSGTRRAYNGAPLMT